MFVSTMRQAEDCERYIAAAKKSDLASNALRITAAQSSVETLQYSVARETRGMVYE